MLLKVLMSFKIILRVWHTCNYEEYTFLFKGIQKFIVTPYPESA